MLPSRPESNEELSFVDYLNQKPLKERLDANIDAFLKGAKPKPNNINENEEKVQENENKKDQTPRVNLSYLSRIFNDLALDLPYAKHAYLAKVGLACAQDKQDSISALDYWRDLLCLTAINDILDHDNQLKPELKKLLNKDGILDELAVAIGADANESKEYGERVINRYFVSSYLMICAAETKEISSFLHEKYGPPPSDDEKVMRAHPPLRFYPELNEFAEKGFSIDKAISDRTTYQNFILNNIQMNPVLKKALAEQLISYYRNEDEINGNRNNEVVIEQIEKATGIFEYNEAERLKLYHLDNEGELEDKDDAKDNEGKLDEARIIRSELEKMQKEYETMTVQEWNNQVRGFLKMVFNIILKKNNLDPDDLNFAVCLSGSYAKGQATPFSDLDCFLIIHPLSKNKEQYKYIVKDFELIFRTIFDRYNQLASDPIGINPAKFYGTPKKLANMIKKNQVADAKVFQNSVYGASYLFGDTTHLLEDLKQELSIPREVAAKNAYDAAVNDFSGPRNSESINIKSDITRVVDAVLAGLRYETGIDGNHGQNLDWIPCADDLLACGKITPEIYAIIKTLHNDVIPMRMQFHNEEKKESDVVKNNTDFAKLRPYIDLVAILRGIAAKRLLELNNGKEIKDLPPFRISNYLQPEYQDNTFKAEDRVVNLAAIYHDAAELRKKNTAQAQLYRDAANIIEANSRIQSTLDQLEQQLSDSRKQLSGNLSSAIQEIIEASKNLNFVDTDSNNKLQKFLNNLLFIFELNPIRLKNYMGTVVLPSLNEVAATREDTFDLSLACANLANATRLEIEERSKGYYEQVLARSIGIDNQTITNEDLQNTIVKPVNNLLNALCLEAGIVWDKNISELSWTLIAQQLLERNFISTEVLVIIESLQKSYSALVSNQKINMKNTTTDEAKNLIDMFSQVAMLRAVAKQRLESINNKENFSTLTIDLVQPKYATNSLNGRDERCNLVPLLEAAADKTPDKSKAEQYHLAANKLRNQSKIVELTPGTIRKNAAQFERRVSIASPLGNYVAILTNYYNQSGYVNQDEKNIKKINIKTTIETLNVIINKTSDIDQVKDELIAQLFEFYRAALKAEPKDYWTRTLALVLAKILGVESVLTDDIDKENIGNGKKIDRNLTSDQVYAEIVRHLPPQIFANKQYALEYPLNKMAEKFAKPSLLLKLRYSQKDRDLYAKILTDAKTAIDNKQPIRNFNFPHEAWKILNKNNFSRSEWKGLLLAEVDNQLQGLVSFKDACQETFPNAADNIDELIKRVNKSRLGTCDVSHEQLVLLINTINQAHLLLSGSKQVDKDHFAKFVKVRNLTMSTPDEQYRLYQADLLKQCIFELYDVEVFHPFLKPLTILDDDQIEKRKLITELENKINEGHFNPFLRAFDPEGVNNKKRALEQLKTDVENAKHGEKFSAILTAWMDKHGTTIHQQRQRLFAKPVNTNYLKDKDPANKTKTDEFIEQLSTRYGNVKLKSKAPTFGSSGN